VRCLPAHRIERTDVHDKIVFDEHPALAGFGGRDLAGFGLFPQCCRRHAEEFGGFLESERTHGSYVLLITLGRLFEVLTSFELGSRFAVSLDVLAGPKRA